MGHKRSRIAQTFLRKKSKAGGITLPDFRNYYKATGIKPAWHWHKNRHTDQSSEREPTHLQPISLQQRRQEHTTEKRESFQQRRQEHTTEKKSFQQSRQEHTTEKKDSLFSILCWESRTAACKPMKLEHTPCHAQK